MHNKLSVPQALNVFSKIAQYGKRTDEDTYTLDGMLALSSPDGYTVTLKDEQVSVSIFFHNTYEFDYDDSSQIDGFLQKISEIDQKRYE